MKTYSILGNRITFHFNPPEKEGSFKNKEFNYSTQICYRTIGIDKLLKYDNDEQIQIIMKNILNILSNQSYKQKLYIFQILYINRMPVLCGDDGYTILLTTLTEYLHNNNL